MRRFGRQCRGQGHVFVKLVRQTELLLLECGQPINTLGQQGQRLLALASHLRPTKRERLASERNAAMDAHTHIRTQSIRLTQGKKLSHCKIVNAYDPTIAPILKGKSNCPAQFGRKPGLVSEPATGFIFANRVPEGNPCDASYVLPLLDKVQGAIERVRTAPRRQIHSVVGDLGINDAALRQALHQRGILTVGIPKTDAAKAAPTPAETTPGRISEGRAAGVSYGYRWASAAGSPDLVSDDPAGGAAGTGAAEHNKAGSDDPEVQAAVLKARLAQARLELHEALRFKQEAEQAHAEEQAAKKRLRAE